MDTSDPLPGLVDAAERGDLALARRLLEAGGPAVGEPVLGEALRTAAFHGHHAVVALLLNRGAPIDARSTSGWTALHHAIENIQPAVVEQLLRAGADVNGAEANGWTPLHHAIDIEVEAAIHRYDTEGVDLPPEPTLTALLLAHGADVSVRTRAGETPRMLASKRRHRAALALLEAHGATD